MAGKISGDNFRKTIYFLKRNGIKNTCYAIWERLTARRQSLYRYIPPTDAELKEQRAACRITEPEYKISIVVPCYRTSPAHLLDMINSVRCQTYGGWELILADATEDDSVERTVDALADPGIRYFRLPANEGIAQNTNCGILKASGDYIGLLDHDDLLTPDALFWISSVLSRRKKDGKATMLLYSDEDKCDGEGNVFYEPNRKEDFNLDLLLSNNYICHFLVIEGNLMRKLLLRGEYDGAQDYDLVLRAARELAGREDAIVHIPRVLYHWRCHEASTAANPKSKQYAYEAGRRALQDYADGSGWRARAEDTVHLGFYRLNYEGDLFAARPDVGAVGGPLIWKNRICGGRMSEDGTVFYRGLRRHFAGYLNRASLGQDAEALDIRNIRVRQEAWELFQEVTGVPWKTVPGRDIFDVSALPDGTDCRAVSLALGRALREKGYRLLYLPEKERILRHEKNNGCDSKL